MTHPLTGGLEMKGSFVIRSHRAGEITDTASMKAAMCNPLYEHPRIENLIVSSSGYGRNLLLRAMSGDTTYPVLIDSASIGTGNTAPADANTGLVASVLAAIPVGIFELTNDVLIVTFFIPDADLANGTYKEFATWMGTQMFSRALISPNYVKTSLIDTTIEYTFTFST